MTADGFAIYLVSIACAVIGGLFVVIAPIVIARRSRQVRDSVDVVANLRRAGAL